jgi:excisionase family DNA binding protein
MDLNSQKMLSTAQAAEVLGVSASFLNKQRLRGGQIPFYKVGARVLYASRDLADFLESRKRSSTSQIGPSPTPR